MTIRQQTPQAEGCVSAKDIYLAFGIWHSQKVLFSMAALNMQYKQEIQMFVFQYKGEIKTFVF